MAAVQEFVEQHIGPEIVTGYCITALAAFGVAMAEIRRRRVQSEHQTSEPIEQVSEMAINDDGQS